MPATKNNIASTEPFDAAQQHPTAQWKHRSRQSGNALLLGALIAFAAAQLDLDSLLITSDYVLIFGAVAGLLIGLTRWRAMLFWIAGALVLTNVVVLTTPLVPWLTRDWLTSDPLEPCDAVVILGSTVHGDGSLSASEEERLLHGLSIVRRGYARGMVVTHGALPEQVWSPAIVKLLDGLQLSCPIDDLGPVSNTHDEAIAVAQLLRSRRWKRVILVTEPSHMRRAAATFVHAGVNVLRSPCTETRYDLGQLPAGDRMRAFRDWLHETVGYRIYHHRQWL